MKNTLPNFAGKTVTFSTTDATLAVENPHFEMQGDKLFVVGTVPKGASSSDWAIGVRCAVAWSEVDDYMIFDSPHDYTKRLAKSRNKNSHLERSSRF